MGTEEKRQAFRMKIANQKDLNISLNLPDGKCIEGKIENLSPLGAKISLAATLKSMELPEFLSMTLVFPEKTIPEIPCIIHYRKDAGKSDPTEQGISFVGLEFEQMEPEDEAVIQKYINDSLLAEKRAAAKKAAKK